MEIRDPKMYAGKGDHAEFVRMEGKRLTVELEADVELCSPCDRDGLTDGTGWR